MLIAQSFDFLGSVMEPGLSAARFDQKVYVL